MIKNFCFLMIFLALSGCTKFENLFSLSQKNWVTIEDDPLLLSGHGLHIRIKEGLIWEVGNEAHEVSRQIHKSLKVRIDDTAIAANRLLSVDILQFPREVYANNGQRLGSHYDSSDIYVFELKLTEGLHKGFIEVISVSGVTYTYSWQFIVKYT